MQRALLGIRRPRSAARGTALALAGSLLLVSATVGAATTAAAGDQLGSQAAASDRIDLRVLVVTDGGSNVEAILAQLRGEGVPTTVVDTRSADRQAITADFLSDTVSTGPRARFQSVVLANQHGSFQLSEAELASLAEYEARFGIRRVNSYVYPGADLGMASPTTSGPLDGKPAAVTAAGLAGDFRYLDGAFPVDNTDVKVEEAYGYLADPAPAMGTTFTSLVTVEGKPVVGAYTGTDSREQLVITSAFNAGQTYFRLMAPGIVSWMTRGVHLGQSRSYFAVHADDVLVPSARWSMSGNCTPGDDCTRGETTKDIRMTAADVGALVSWQQKNGLLIDVAFNGAGSDEAIAAKGRDPLTSEILKQKAQLRFLNHTYTHQFLGCIKDFTVLPWRCQRDANGAVQYLSQEEISKEIRSNLDWAARNGISLDPTDLVTGEHSGLRTGSQQPEDNPNLAAALSENGILSIASDASREKEQRRIGSALTTMRHPTNVFYNVATEAEETDEYNWIYTRRSQGGSGICEDNAQTSTCLPAPLNTKSGYRSHIVPVETRIALGHVLSNDPRPHYLHQANLAEQRIAYPLLESVIKSYNGWFADNAPLVNLPQRQLGEVMRRSAAWAASSSQVEGYLLDGVVHLTSTGSAPIEVPLTVPASAAFGEAYAGERSGHQLLPAGGSFAVAVRAS